MDPDLAQLRIIGKFISTPSRPGSIADNATASQSNAGTQSAAYPAHAEGLVTNERAVIAGIE